jgi:hypothetical protein
MSLTFPTGGQKVGQDSSPAAGVHAGPWSEVTGCTGAGRGRPAQLWRVAPPVVATFRKTKWHLQQLLYSNPPQTREEHRRRSAAISRKLRLLRAHGLIRKRPHSHRYDLTRKGRLILITVLAAHAVTARQINTIAA